MDKKRLLLYLGDTLVGDINQFAKNRKLTETLKSEADNPSADTFTFDINWKLFSDFIRNHFEDEPANFLRVGKTRIIFEIDGFVRFAGWLSSKPARSGLGASQTLSLTFYEWFARLSGDVVCSATNKLSPVRNFNNVPAHQYVQALIGEFMNRAEDAGETLNWDFGHVDTLANKTVSYKDFQTVAKALCDAMDNVTGAGKFDIVFRTDPADYTHQFIDILKPRGTAKNIIIQYPSDGVYKLWANDYAVQETNEYASEVIIAGNGQIGDESETTAKIGTANNSTFVQDYCYFRTYTSQSNLESQDAVDDFALTKLAASDFDTETPEITLVGRPIAWGNASDQDYGLAVGDSFYFNETNDDGTKNSGWYRIIGMDTSWDNNGVATVTPQLKREELLDEQ